MQESISMQSYRIAKRTLIRFQQNSGDEPLENIEVTVSSEPLVTAAAAELAVGTLLKDLSTFEPPIVGASKDDIVIYLGTNAVSPTVTASYQRNDYSTTSIPEGYETTEG